MKLYYIILILLLSFPTVLFAKGKPLLVVLHGCNQTAREILEVTDAANIAHERGYEILVPKQSFVNNPYGCWNWFSSRNQGRKGETDQIAQLVKDRVLKGGVNKKRVFIMGLSSGAAMANILAYCYPEIFAGAAMHSGIGFGMATNIFEADKVMKSGSPISSEEAGDFAKNCAPNKNLYTPMVFLSGSEDKVVNQKNLEDQVEQFREYLGFETWLDTVHIKHRGEYPYAQTNIIDSSERVVAQALLVRGLGHSWSGGQGSGKYADPKGPNATTMFLDFFDQVAKDDACEAALRRKL
jgi:poly(hydroxyalkanoate) depolymerase family esterase